MGTGLWEKSSKLTQEEMAALGAALVKLQDTVLRRNLRHLIPLTDPRTHELAQRAEGEEINLNTQPDQ